MNNVLRLISILVYMVSIMLTYLVVYTNFKDISQDKPSMYGMILGLSLRSLKFASIISLFFYPLWKWVLPRYFGAPKKGVGVLSFAMLFFFVSLYTTISINKLEAQENNQSAEQNIQFLSKQGFSKQEIDSMRTAMKLNEKYEKYLIGEMEKINEAAERVDITNIYKLEYIMDLEKIKKALFSLKAYMNELSASEIRVLDNQKQASVEVDKFVNESFKNKQEFLKGYNKGKDALNFHISENYRIKKALVTEYQNLLEFLGSIHGDYKVDGNNLTFLTDAQIDKFGELITNIKKLDEEENQNINEIERLAG